MTKVYREPISILIMASVRWYNAEAEYAFQLAEGLKKAGHSVTLFGIPESPLIKKAKENDIDVIDEINLMKGIHLCYIKDMIYFNRIIQERNFDLIHPHISRDHTFIYLSRTDKSIPVIRTRNNSIPPNNNVFNRYFYAHSADHYTVSSGSMVPTLRKIGVDESIISVVPLEIDQEKFIDYNCKRNLRRELAIPDDRIIVSFIGRLDRIKGVEHFIRSYPLLKDRRRFHYIISGEEINITTDYLMNVADELRIDNIAFLGRLHDVREILSVTDIGVIPSIGSEAICRIALEMLSFGIPIVGSNINSIPEIISDNYGIIVDPGRPEKIAEALDSLAFGDVYRKMRNDIRLRIKKHSPERFISSYCDIYLKTLDV
ncbi:MAG: glycosyltransferase family 4 protein [Spirochaetota bacterium]|nr:glycosyltransferase family 4 protein [Spirochaetota bacterium]